MDGVIEIESRVIVTGAGSRAEENPPAWKPAENFIESENQRRTQRADAPTDRAWGHSGKRVSRNHPHVGRTGQGIFEAKALNP